MFRFMIYAFLVLYFIVSLKSEKMLGPADIIFDKMVDCDPAVRDFYIGIEKYRINRTTEELNITLTSPFTIDSSVMVTLNASTKKEGGWKPGAMFYQNSLCKTAENMLGDTFHEILSKLGYDDCPLPEGSYEIGNYYLDNENYDVEQVYGDYRMELLIEKTEDDDNSVVKGCFLMYYSFEPKEEE